MNRRCHWRGLAGLLLWRHRIRFNADCHIRRPGPTLGQDNRYVIEELLGETMPTEDARAGVLE